MTDDLIIVGEQAYTPEEYERRKKSSRKRDAAYWRAWRAKNGDKYRQYQRQYQRVARTLKQSDEELERKIAYHRRWVEHYERELRYRAKDRAA